MGVLTFQMLAVLLALAVYTEAALLTVVTYNIANYNDHLEWPERLQLLTQDLIQANADFIALQEVRFDPDENTTKTYYQNMGEEILYQLNRNGAYIGAHIVNQPTMYYGPGEYPLPASLSPTRTHSFWEGSTIISKRRILETGTIFLTKTPQCTDSNLRATQYIAVDISDDLPLHAPHHLRSSSDILYIYNTHFGLAGQCLIDNVNETIGYMSRFASSPSILLGDMNATPDNAALAPLAENGLIDVWTLLFPDQAGLSFPSNKPTERIDYCWANKAMAILAQNMTLIGSTPGPGSVYPSDHLGFLITFNTSAGLEAKSTPAPIAVADKSATIVPTSVLEALKAQVVELESKLANLIQPNNVQL